MNAKRIIHAAAFFLLFAGSLAAQVDEKKARSVLDVTGVTSQAESFPQVIIGMFEQQKSSFSDEQQKKLYDILGSSFGQTKFDAYVFDAMIKNYNDAYCDVILTKYKDPFFLDVTQTEIKSNTAQIFSEIAAFDYATVDKERDAIIEDYLENSSTIKFQELLTVSGIEAFIKTYNLFLPKENKITPDVANAIITQAKQQINSPEQRMLLKKNFAVIYRKYSNRQLRVYFDFYKTAEARWLSDAFCAGFQTGFESCMNDAAKRITSEFHIAGESI
jgi:hypothetical protein